MPSNQHRPTERVLDILELLSTNPDGMTLTQLSRALNAPKSSIMPLVHTMTSRKFIYQHKDTSRYCMGIAAYSVGSSYTNTKNALEFIQSEMKYIVSQSNETCQLGIQVRSNLLYIAKEDSAEPLRLVSYVGKQIPLYCTAIGRALLAQKTKDEIRALEEKYAKLECPIADWEELFRELEQTRNRGYALEHEECMPLLNCAGIPLCSNGQVIAALSVCIPTFRYSEDKLQSIIRLLKESKAKLETYFQGCDVDLGSIS